MKGEGAGPEVLVWVAVCIWFKTAQLESHGAEEPITFCDIFVGVLTPISDRLNTFVRAASSASRSRFCPNGKTTFRRKEPSGGKNRIDVIIIALLLVVTADL